MQMAMVIDSTGVAARIPAGLRAEQAYQTAKDAFNHSEHRRFNQPSRKSSSEQAKADAEAAKAAAQAES